MWCKARHLVKHLECNARHLAQFWSAFVQTFWCKATILFKANMGEKGDFWSIVCGAKKDFCSNIWSAVQDFFSNIFNAKQDFCSNIFGAKQQFCSKILGEMQDLSFGIFLIILGAKQDFV